MNEKHQDKKGKAICKYYIEGRCTWVREDECRQHSSLQAGWSLTHRSHHELVLPPGGPLQLQP